MNFGLFGTLTPQEMRKQRIKEIIEKVHTQIKANPGLIINNGSEQTLSLQGMQLSQSKETMDNASFVQKYLDSVNNKQYLSYFASYNQSMFAQLLMYMSHKEVPKGEFLYQKDDVEAPNMIFFILRGKIELLVPTNLEGQGLKFSKNVDEGEFFTYRSDFAKSAALQTEVIAFDKNVYDRIIKRTQLSTGEKKIEFLLRYVSKLRKAPRKMVEELEVFFIKEELTKGYQIQKQDEQDDYLYIIYKGKVRQLIQTAKYPFIFPQTITSDQNKKHLVLGQLGRGDHFGEHSAFNDLPNPCTIEVLTSKCEIYKIHRSHFIQYFGGLDGEPLQALRASILLKTNWINMKMDFLRQFSLDQISQLEYRNEDEILKLKPTKQIIKEIPFMKNNPKMAQTNGTSENGVKSETQAQPKTEEVKTERQRKIEELKAGLLAPMQKQAPLPSQAASGVGGMMGMNKIDRGAEGDKFSKVMDWGTPRLVTKNRQLQMDPNQMKQRNFLQNLAQERKGILNNVEEEKKGDFAQVSVNSFRERMLKEEKMSHSIDREEKDNSIHKQIAATNNTSNIQNAVPGGMNFFQKMKNTNEEEVKTKLKSSFRGLPI